MEDILVPLAFFGVIPLTVFTVSYFRHKSHTNASEVMRTLLEKGDALTPDTIQALGIRPSKPHGDLRLGSILVAVALATIIMGQVIPEEDSAMIMAGIAMFPLLVGLAYIGLWVFISRKTPPA